MWTRWSRVLWQVGDTKYLTALVLASAGGCVLALAAAWRLGSELAITAVSGIAAVVALALAYVAVLPVLEDRRRRPNVLLYAQLYDGADGIPQNVPADPIERSREPQAEWREGHATVEGLDFYLRVVVDTFRSTRSVVDAMLNIVVPAECMIKPHQVPPGTEHYLYPGVDHADLTGLGDIVPVRFTVRERTFGPGNAFVTRVRVRTPKPGMWPVLLILDGDPDHHRRTRVLVSTTNGSGA